MDSSWVFASGLVFGCSLTAVVATALGRGRASPYAKCATLPSSTAGACGPSEPLTLSVSSRTIDSLGNLKDGNLSTEINTKIKRRKPAYDISRFWYSIYGMDTHPGYLRARFAEPRNHVKDLAWLENQLEDKLESVKQAKHAVAIREKLLATYEPKMTLPEPDRIFPPTLLEAARHKLHIPKALEEIETGVYTFQLFTPEFCELLLDQVEHFGNWKRQVTEEGRPGSEDLNARLCTVDHMGVVGEKLLDTLRDVIIDPLSKTLFPEVDDPNSRSHFRFGFILGYSDKPGDNLISRKALDAHTDDAEVTLTVCLGREYQGGEVSLRYLRDDPDEGKEQTRFKMKTGEASLFLGQQLHQVSEVTGGERYIFVVWFRRHEYRAAHCPCCRMFRRSRCVFGAEFN